MYADIAIQVTTSVADATKRIDMLSSFEVMAFSPSFHASARA
jgi:hypothetical protein